MAEGQDEAHDEGWHWFVASINGMGDFAFEAKLSLALGELPHQFQVRKFTNIMLQQLEGGGAAPSPVMSLAEGLGLIEVEEAGVLNSHCIVRIAPAADRLVRLMTEVYKKTKIIVPQKPIPKIDFANLKGGKH